MKNFIALVTIMLLVVGVSNAQTFTEVTKVGTSTVLNTEITIESATYGDTTIQVKVNGEGNYIYLRTSKKGNEYPQYLGYDSGLTYEGKMVFTDKNKSKYWYLGLTSGKNPKKFYLLMDK